MYHFHIPQCTIQNRNVHISVLNVALWDMEHVHCEICELGRCVRAVPDHQTPEYLLTAQNWICFSFLFLISRILNNKLLIRWNGFFYDLQHLIMRCCPLFWKKNVMWRKVCNVNQLYAITPCSLDTCQSASVIVIVADVLAPNRYLTTFNIGLLFYLLLDGKKSIFDDLRRMTFMWRCCNMRQAPNSTGFTRNAFIDLVTQQSRTASPAC